jgi:hypothetical protein
MPHTTPSHTPRAMTPAEKLQIEQAAQWGISDSEKARISSFLREINPSDLDQFDAITRASLDGIINELAQDHSHDSHDHWPRLSNAEYLRKAQYILGLNESTQGDKELYQFQMYFNMAHNDANDIYIDGASWPQTIGAITSHVNATQVFLKELWADIDVNGTIGDTTKAAIKEYFGFDIMTGIAVVAVEAVVAEIDRIQSLSDAELLAALQEANENQPDKLSDKRAYIAEFVRRYKEAWNSVVPDSSNRYTLVDISGNSINTTLWQQDLQSMMVLLATSGDDIFNRDLLKENIANNMFDHVVKTYDFKKSNGRTWQWTDFVSDSVRTEDQVQENKTACVWQIDAKIQELREKNKLPTTTDDQKKVNILAIQKLEIAKIFVVDQTRLSEGALVIARSITENRVEIARALGTSEEEITRAYNQIESGDWKDLAFSMIGPGILALIFGFLSRLIPEWAMRTAFNASIVGLLGITAYSNAQEMGLTGTRTWSTTGRNTPNINTPAALQAQADIVRAILTAAPKWLESRHKDVYVKVVQLNNEPGKWYFDDRPRLDTTYLALSQDPVFAQQDVSNFSSITTATAFDFVDPSYTKSLLQGQWVTWEELMNMIKMLIEVNGDTEDTKAQDLFIAGQVTDTLNNSNITWIQGSSFEAINLDINKTVSRISGISFGADESLRSNSVRAQVEEALAKAQPSALEWLGQGLADRIGFVADQEPTAANIGEVITALEAITATGSNETQISSLLALYSTTKEALEQNETVYAYLSEAKWVYTYIGSAGRLGEDVITWRQGWGDTIPTNPNPAVTTDSIQVLIASWITHAGTLDANPDLQKEVLTAVENLRLYKIKMLDDAARVASLTPTEKTDLLNKSDETLAAVIAASPEVYMATLANLEIELAGLTNTYTSTDGYLRAFSGKKSELVTLQRLARITTWDTAFDTKAATVYRDIYTAWFATNLKTHLTTKITWITSFDTSAATLDEVTTKQTEFNTLRNEILLENWVVDLITYFGTPENTVQVSGQAYLNVPNTINNIFSQIDNSHTAIVFDETIVQAKQIELDTARLGLEWGFDVTITPPTTDAELLDPIKMSAYVTAINAMHTDIESLSDDWHEATKLEELRVQVSAVIDRLTTKLNDPSVWLDMSLITPISNVYNILITSKLGNTGDERFENILASKNRDIAIAKYEEKLNITTLWHLSWWQKQHINEFIWGFSSITLNSSLTPIINALKNDKISVLVAIDLMNAIANEAHISSIWGFNGLLDSEIWDYTGLTAVEIRGAAWVAVRDFKGALSQNDIFSTIFTTYWNILSLDDYFQI